MDERRDEDAKTVPRGLIRALAAGALVTACVFVAIHALGRAPTATPSSPAFEIDFETARVDTHEYEQASSCGKCMWARCKKGHKCGRFFEDPSLEGKDRPFCMCSCCRMQCGFPQGCDAYSKTPNDDVLALVSTPELTGDPVTRVAGIAWSADGSVAYLGDELGHRISEMRADTFEVRTLAGSGAAGFADGRGASAQFDQPHGLALVPGEAEPTLAVADTRNNRVRLLNIGTGDVTTLAGEGSWDWVDDNDGSRAMFASPNGVAAGEPSGSAPGSGFVLVADTSNNCVRRAALDGATSTVAGAWLDHQPEGAVDAVGLLARFSEPKAVVLSADSLVAYVLDSENSLVRAVDLQTRKVTTVAGNGHRGDRDGYDGSFDQPRGMTLLPSNPARPDAHGRLLVADTNNHILRSVDLDNCQAGAAGEPGLCFITTIAGRTGLDEHADGQGSSARFNSPIALAATPRPGGGAVVLCSDMGSRRLRRVEVAFRADGDVY